MYDILKKYPPQNEEKLSDKRAREIKAAVLSRIKEEKAMKKHFSIKTISIAAAVATTAAVSAMIASAENAPMSPLVRNDAAIAGSAAEPTTSEPEAAEPTTSAPEATEPSASAPKAAETPKNEGKKVTYTEMTGDIPTEQRDGKWVYLDCPNGTKAEFYLPDGKAPMSFDSAKAAIDYCLGNPTPSDEEEYVSSFDCCDNFAVILVDA